MGGSTKAKTMIFLILEYINTLVYDLVCLLFLDMMNNLWLTPVSQKKLNKILAPQLPVYKILYK